MATCLSAAGPLMPVATRKHGAASRRDPHERVTTGQNARVRPPHRGSQISDLLVPSTDPLRKQTDSRGPTDGPAMLDVQMPCAANQIPLEDDKMLSPGTKGHKRIDRCLGDEKAPNRQPLIP